MSMNKKELARLAELEREAAVNRALRWSDATTITPDVPVPDRGYSTGWLFNSHSERVEQAWSGPVTHGTGSPAPRAGISGTQQGRRLFSSKALALRAMRCEMEMRFARILARVDEQIVAADAEATR